MNRDHTGEAYSISTDDEDRFEFLVKQIKNALREGKNEAVVYYESLLNQEFSSLRFKNNSW